MQNTVDNPECSAVVGQSFVTEPINVGNIADNAYGQNERDNLCQRPQIIFLLHKYSFWFRRQK
jgi:hypothetical protein